MPAAFDGRHVIYGIRPEHLSLAEDGIDGSVRVLEPTGAELQVVCRVGSQEVMAAFRERHSFRPGDPIRLRFDAARVHLFDAKTGERLAGETGRAH
jgi:multiple sugar transport system ATP-binding protein